MKYKLKPEYEGITISRNVMGLGNVIFDANNVEPEKYHNYVKMGFEFLFELVIDEVIEWVGEKVEDWIEIKQEERQKNKIKKLPKFEETPELSSTPILSDVVKTPIPTPVVKRNIKKK